MERGVKIFSLFLIVLLFLCSFSSVYAEDTNDIADLVGESNFNENMGELSLENDLKSNVSKTFENSAEDSMANCGDVFPLGTVENSIANCDEESSLSNSDESIISTNEKAFFNLKLEIRNNPDNLTLTDDYAYNPLLDDSNLISITNDNYVLDGAGHTIDGGHQVGILSIAGNHVTLKNIRFINANCDVDGAVSFYNVCTIINCTFENNTAIKGALYIEQIGNIINCTFTGNNGSQGGAAYFERDGSIFNSTFTGNNGSQGGAVYFKQGGLVEGSQFKDNNAEDGGAIFGGSGSVLMSNSYFEDNTAQNDGGAVSIYDGTAIDSNFTSNIAHKNGGGICSRYGLMVIRSNFESNEAMEGGAICGYNAGTIENNTFDSNYAEMDGGSVYFGEYAQIYYNDFSYNRANHLGGAVYCDNILVILNNTFYRNNASDGTENVSSKRTFDKKVYHVDTNAADSGDGSLRSPWKTLDEAIEYCDMDEIILIHSGTYSGTGNTALNISKSFNLIAYDEGVIFDARELSKIFNLNNVVAYIEGITFKNGFDYCGGAISVSSESVVTINNSYFQSNIASDNGGAILTDGYLEINNCSFYNNRQVFTSGDTILYAGGGAITSTFPGSTLVVRDSIFKDNRAVASAGAIQDGYVAIIDNCTFINNTAENGGAIRAYVTSDLVFTNRSSRFISNYAKEFGGAINLVYLKSPTYNLYFENNSADTGGAIYGLYSDHVWVFGGEIRVHLCNCSFINNTARDDGWAGAIGFAVDKYECKLILDGCYFEKNSACYGGSIYSAGTLRFEGEKTVFKENYARTFYVEDDNMDIISFGGAIMHFGNFDFTTEVDFISNVAEGFGGAVAACGSEYHTSIMNAFFYDNKCGWGGGAIYTLHDLIIKSCHFEGNYAINTSGNTPRDISGGTIYSYRYGVELEIIHNNFVNIGYKYGQYVFGDAIYINGTYKNISDNYYKDRNGNTILGAYSRQSGLVYDTNPASAPYESLETLANVDNNPLLFGEDNASLSENQNTFTSLNNLIQGSLQLSGHLDLERDYVFNPRFDRSFVYGITMNVGIIAVIDGHGHSIDGSAQAAIFNVVGAGGSLTLQNIVFRNVGYSIHMKDCYEEEAPHNVKNPKTLLNALHIVNAMVNIVNCTFINNNCPEYGAINAKQNSRIFLEGCTAQGNKAEYGAAISTDSSTGAQVMNCTFISNTATDGGAIHISSGPDSMEREFAIAESSFIRNRALNYGGSIFSEDYDEFSLVLAGLKFLSNNADVGGALYLDCDFSISDSNFTNNSAKTAGGAYLGNLRARDAMDLIKIMALNDCRFVDNTATEICSDLYLSSDIRKRDTFKISNNYFRQKSSLVPSIYFKNERSGVNFNFTNNSFIAQVSTVNEITFMSIDTEGNIFFAENWWGVNDPSAYKISITINGGNMHFPDNTPIRFSLTNLPIRLDIGRNYQLFLRPYIHKNKTDMLLNYIPFGVEPTGFSTDGNLRIEENLTNKSYNVFFTPTRSGQIRCSVSVDNQRFETAVSCGKDYTWHIVVGGGTVIVSIIASAIIGTYANDSCEDGGPNDFYTIQDAIDAADDGDAIMLNPGVYKGSGNVGLNINKNITIMSNPDKEGQVIIDAEGKSQIWDITASRVNVLGITFKNGLTGGDGGALKFNAPLENCTIIANFTNNKASNGGAIYFASTGGNISYAVFTSNEATYDGGAVYFSNGGVIENDSFTYNLAERGGAIFQSGILSKSNIYFEGNDAKEGKDIFIFGTEDLNLGLIINNITEGQDVFMEITTDERYSGDVLVEIGDASCNVTVANGYGNGTIGPLGKGTYTAVASCEGSELFRPCNVTCKFEVLPKPLIDPDLIISINNVTFGQPALVEINANANYTNDVSIFLNFDTSKVYTVKVVDGYGNTTIDGLDVGTYVAVAYSEAIGEFDVASDFTEFEVLERELIDPDLTVNVQNVTVGKPVLVEIHTNDSFSGNVSVELNGSQQIKLVKITEGYGNVSLEDLAIGNYTVTVIFNETDVFRNSTAVAEFEVCKKESIDPEIDVLVPDVIVVGTDFIEINANEEFTASVAVKFNSSDEIFTVDIIDGKGEIPIVGLSVGKYAATITFDGDEVFKPISLSFEFEISPKGLIDPDLAVNVQNVTVGEPVFLEVHTNDTFRGNVSVELNGSEVSRNVEIIGGYGSTSFDGLAAGNYMATVIFNATDIFKRSIVTVGFEVFAKELLDPDLTVIAQNVTVGEPVFLEVHTNDTFSGNVSVELNGSEDSRNVEIIGGYGSASFDGLAAGNYTATVIFNATDIFNRSIVTVGFEVFAKELLDPDLTAIAQNISVGDSALIEIHTNDAINGYVTVRLNGSEDSRNVEIIGGYGSTSFDDLAAGNYTVTVIFDETDVFKNSTAVADFEVSLISPNLRIKVANTTFGEPLVIELTTNQKFSGNITLRLNNSDVNYVADITEGCGNITVNGLNVGNYMAFAFFNKTDIFKKSIKWARFEVHPADANLNVDVKNIAYGGTAKINVKISSNGKAVNEGKISVVIGKKIYAVYVRNGTAVISVPGLNAGSYSGNVLFDGGSNYNESVARFSFNVLKQKTSILAKNKAFVINYGGKYSVTLRDAKGKALANRKLTFILAGKTVGSVKTNAKGVATVKITAKFLKKIKAGKKNLVIKFAGEKNFNAVSKKVKVTVKKEKTRLTAKKKTFKRKLKYKKYWVVLKNSKKKAIRNVRVILKVKGKNYKAKTNRRGKAVFRIKNLKKKGKYTARIRFAGNRYYYAVSKKAIIKVK